MQALHEIAFIAITEDVSLIVSINLLHGRDEPAALVRAVGSLAKAPLGAVGSSTAGLAQHGRGGPHSPIHSNDPQVCLCGVVGEVAMTNVGRAESVASGRVVQTGQNGVSSRSVKKPIRIPTLRELPSVAELAAAIRKLPEVRRDLIEQVKAELAAGTYETSERIDIAVERLMAELYPGL